MSFCASLYNDLLNTHQMPDEFILDYLPSALILDFLGHRDRAAPAFG